MADFVKVTFIVFTAVVLQGLLTVSQLTTDRRDSVNKSSGNYVIDILSPDMHISEMKQVNVCVTVRLQVGLNL